MLVRPTPRTPQTPQTPLAMAPGLRAGPTPPRSASSYTLDDDQLDSLFEPPAASPHRSALSLSLFEDLPGSPASSAGSLLSSPSSSPPSSPSSTLGSISTGLPGAPAAVPATEAQVARHLRERSRDARSSARRRARAHLLQLGKRKPRSAPASMWPLAIQALRQQDSEAPAVPERLMRSLALDSSKGAQQLARLHSELRKKSKEHIASLSAMYSQQEREAQVAVDRALEAAGKRAKVAAAKRAAKEKAEREQKERAAAAKAKAEAERKAEEEAKERAKQQEQLARLQQQQQLPPASPALSGAASSPGAPGAPPSPSSPAAAPPKEFSAESEAQSALKMLLRLNRLAEESVTSGKIVKRQQLDAKKAINRAVGQITRDQQQITAKVQEIYMILKRAQELDGPGNKGLQAFAFDVLAAKIVGQAAVQVFKHQASAFAFAAVAVALSDRFPPLPQAILAHFYKACPFLMPDIPEELPREGPNESVENVFKRLEGYVALFAAMLVTPSPRYAPAMPGHPFALRRAWNLLAAYGNMNPPHPFAARLETTLLAICGEKLFQAYPRQMPKLVKVLRAKQLPLFDKENALEADVHRVTAILEAADRDGRLPAHEGSRIQ